MAFTLFARHAQGVQLLQRSLARGRLGHAYLFAGDRLEELESLARTLAKTLNCQKPVKTGGAATDCCDDCPAAAKLTARSRGHPLGAAGIQIARRHD
jgi:DNA polymerase III gamma/tau subunit